MHGLSVHLPIPIPFTMLMVIHPRWTHYSNICFWGGVFSKLSNDFPLQYNASPLDILSSVPRTCGQDCPNETLYFSQAAQAHDVRSYYYCFNLYANVQRVKRDIFTADIYYYTTTQFDYAKRDSRLTAYGDVVLQQFEITKVCLAKNSHRHYNRNFVIFAKKLLTSMNCCLLYRPLASQLDPKPIKRVVAFWVS